MTTRTNSSKLPNLFLAAFLLATCCFSKPAVAQCLQGDCKNGKGSMAYDDGGRYTGQFLNGSRHGLGSLHQPDGAIYVGEFENDKKNGYGLITFPDRTTYEGQFANDLPDNKGIYTFADRGRYVGDIRDGKKHGRGKHTYPDGTVYEGEFQNDNKHGKGTMTFPDGSSYAGMFADNLPNGVGTYNYADGTKYVGEFEAGKKHGKGEIILADGSVKRGKWQNGELAEADAAAPPGRGRTASPPKPPERQAGTSAGKLRLESPLQEYAFSGNDGQIILHENQATGKAPATSPAAAPGPVQQSGMQGSAAEQKQNNLPPELSGKSTSEETNPGRSDQLVKARDREEIRIDLTRESIDLRSGPSFQNEILTTADRGTTLQILGRRAGWLLATKESKGEKGWVFIPLLAVASGAPLDSLDNILPESITESGNDGIGKKIAQTTAVPIPPSSAKTNTADRVLKSSVTIHPLPQDTPITQTAEPPAPTQTESTDHGSPAQAFAFLTTNRTNMRRGPSLNHAVMKTLDKNIPVRVLDAQQDWVQVEDRDQETGWIIAAMLTDTPPPGCLFVRKDETNLRAGPDNVQPVLKSLAKGIPVVALDRQGDWIHVEEWTGQRGWISAPLLGSNQ